MQYKNDMLHYEDVSLQNLVETYKTPFYVYSTSAIKSQINILKDVFKPIKNVLIAYSVKAEGNISILKIMIENNIGADIVSIGELNRYIKAGGLASNIVFSGVAKSSSEIETALIFGIKQFNIESIAEAIRINEIAGKLNRKAVCAVRVNPNVDAITHKKITTGTYGNKFGISIETIKKNISLLKSLSNIRLEGLDMHIGSQMQSAKPIYEALLVMKSFYEEMLSIGFNIKTLDIGGGFGIVYNATETGFDFDHFRSHSIPLLQSFNLDIILEPGRFLVGQSAALVMKVEYVKEELGRTYVILNAGMNDYLRVALYDAQNEILPTKLLKETMKASIVGPICESSDVFSIDRTIPLVKEGDHMALLAAGAYGASMANNYNSRPLAAQVLVEGTNHRLIRKPQTFEQIIENEIIV